VGHRQLTSRRPFESDIPNSTDFRENVRCRGTTLARLRLPQISGSGAASRSDCRRRALR
jgi:hypothetical protein